MKDSKDKPQYWQDVENKSLSEEFLKSEFYEGENDPQFIAEKGRRDFLKILGFSFSTLPVLSSCVRIPVKKALPYLKKSDQVTPGVANWYATSIDPSFGSSLLVKTREGRPIKIEGNPLSPFTRGGTDSVDQASLLSLYDSRRNFNPRYLGEDISWDKVDSQVLSKIMELDSQGKEVYLITSPISSPSQLRLIKELSEKFSSIRHLVYEPLSDSSSLLANEKDFGQAVRTSYSLESADLVLSFGADFLGTWGSPVHMTKQYSSSRDLMVRDKMLRHIQVESMMSLTGSNADERHTVSLLEQDQIIFDLLAQFENSKPVKSYFSDQKLVKKLYLELIANKGKSIVMSSSPRVETLRAVNRINYLLNNWGKTLTCYDNPYFKGANDVAFNHFIQKLASSQVGGAIFINVNPCYDFFQQEDLVEYIKALDLSVSFSQTPNETSSVVQYELPANYYLESWNDYFTAPSTLSFCQPVIQPLFPSRMPEEFLLSLLSKSDYQGYIKETCLSIFEVPWEKSVHDGIVKTSHREELTYQTEFISTPVLKSESSFELTCYQKCGIRKGQLGDNPWLQELPDPITKATWGNYILISPFLAKEKGVKGGDVLKLELEGRTIELPALIQPGMSTYTLGVAVGYGRRIAGKTAQDLGANVYPFIRFDSGAYSPNCFNIKFSKTGKSEVLAQTQTHHSMEGRDIVREANLDEYREDKELTKEEEVKLISLWPKHDKTGHQWAMAIDLNKCTGCSGCVISCNAENNVPVVGKQEVANRREMHWIRLDRYYKGDESSPEVVHQPVMCQHCDNAPCETVCPVLATVQSSDGLNQQVYNRCVGTRYCANNCPYKVRRFNWFDYPHEDKYAKMVLNPDVTVRSRGVMEKCSMCIQRVQEAKLEAKKQGREPLDGEIKLACQQSCPADAIVFGDLNDPESKLVKYLKNKRNYRLLEELNVKPRVSYLRKIRNKG